MELLGEFDRLVDGLDDDPLVLGAAQRLSFDDLAGDPVADEPGAVLLRRRQPTCSSISSLARIPEIAAMTVIVAVRTMPTSATACSRCSGSVQGRVPSPSARSTMAAFRPKCFSAPTRPSVASSLARSCGIQ